MKRIYDHDSPAADAARERSAEERAARRDTNAEQFLGDGWPEIPALQPITIRPARLTAAEFTRGECPECGEANAQFHCCAGKD